MKSHAIPCRRLGSQLETTDPGIFYEQLFQKQIVDQWLQPHIHILCSVCCRVSRNSRHGIGNQKRHLLVQTAGFALRLGLLGFDLQAVFAAGFVVGAIGGSVRWDFTGRLLRELASGPSSACLFFRYFFCSLQQCMWNFNLRSTFVFVIQNNCD